MQVLESKYTDCYVAPYKDINKNRFNVILKGNSIKLALHVSRCYDINVQTVICKQIDERRLRGNA